MKYYFCYETAYSGKLRAAASDAKPKEKQGTALGIYGAGNVGQSIAVFFAAITLIWGIVFYLFARDAAAAAQPKTLAENLSVLKRSKTA